VLALSMRGVPPPCVIVFLPIGGCSRSFFIQAYIIAKSPRLVISLSVFNCVLCNNVVIGGLINCSLYNSNLVM